MYCRGHKIYLSSGPSYDFVQFRNLVQDITQDFKRISEDIIKIECELRHMQPDLSVHVAHVQDYEKQHLELVIYNFFLITDLMPLIYLFFKLNINRWLACN